MSYPGNIDDCAKPPSRGGLSMKELVELANQMGIATQGLVKAQICDKIREKLQKVKKSVNDDDDDDVNIIKSVPRSSKPKINVSIPVKETKKILIRRKPVETE